MLVKKFDFALTILSSGDRIGCDGLFEIGKAFHTVVKVRDGDIKPMCRKTGKQILKATKGIGALIEVFRLFYQIVGGCTFNKKIDAEKISVCILKETLPCPCRHEGERLPLGIPSRIGHLFFHIGADERDIFHEFGGFPEYFCIDPLQDVLLVRFDEEGVVNVAGTVGAAGAYPAGELELRKGSFDFALVENLFHAYFFLLMKSDFLDDRLA